jgi:outer membrane murein-binding lipoprotein Lpp
MKMLPAMPVLLAVMLTGCSELQNFAAIRPATVRTEECDVDRLMTELHDTRSMNPVQLQQTLKTWEQEFQADPGGNHRLKLALLYAAGDASVRDQGRAQELLNEAAGAPDNPADREFAAVIRQFLDDQIDANRKINNLNKQIADLNKRVAEFEQQQRALTNIEQKIQQRDTPAVIENGK